jgi:hypothetical protein
MTSLRSCRSILFIVGTVVLTASIGGAGCVAGQPATDVSDPGSPLGPTSLGTQPLAYVQDVKPILDADCTQCHSQRDTRGNYSVATYADVMRGQRPGDASSSLVRDSAPGGSMYRYFTGDAVTKATIIFRWMVVDNAAQTR